MSKYKNFISLILFGFILITLTSCNGFNQTDARKFPPNPELRVKKNLEEGRGFRLDSAIKKNMKKSGDFLFASANELWRASLDTIDFMPLSSVNYSGGIIITDWYTDGENLEESVKISIRFLTNEVRADALDIKIFYKQCNQVVNCKISQKTGTLVTELKKEILTKATIYKKEKKDKNFREYNNAMMGDN
tara:strand:- start:5928 stop:6497 length:570 start_codon:yes stop_codon:yes gene_type:complete